MSDRSQTRTRILRGITPVLGIGLLGYLLTTAKLGFVATHAKTIGWGMLLVIAMGGISHLLKTFAWRLTLRREARSVSFGRTFGLRLISEAIGQFGVLGMIGGEFTRVSLLGSRVSLTSAISSVALDRILFVISGLVVTIAGTVTLLFSVTSTRALHLYAGFGAVALAGFVVLCAIAMRRRWPVFSGPARAAARIPWFRTWLRTKESTIKSAETQILSFYQQAPGAFWSSILLNLFCHVLAIGEVYLIIRMIGGSSTLLGALIIESLTKLINVAGALNPGNVGTYEGGTMVIGRLASLTGAQGLLLALCRRVRSIFWAIAGGICLVWFSRKQNPLRGEFDSEPKSSSRTRPTENSSSSFSVPETIVILAHDVPRHGQFEPLLAKVATLPVLLRTILGLRYKGRLSRTIVVVDPVTGPSIRKALLATGRLPGNIEWMKYRAGTTLATILRDSACGPGKVVLVRGNCTYHPASFRMIHEWVGAGGAIEVVSSGNPIGLAALTHEMATDLAVTSESITNFEDLHVWISEKARANDLGQSSYSEVDDYSWQSIVRPEDCISAEAKLEGWLTKPTDGVFARMNRRISIPISRQLIKLPITPNMVSLFVLAVSLIGSGCFALGSYWYTLLGALLGVWTSILDGCDGEVARLKLQVSDFGCWLDSVCDYVYYVTTFAGITIGLVRSTGETRLFGLCVAMFSGVFITFIVASIGRRRLSGKHPEQYLTAWQKKAESRSAGLILNFGRYTEFIIRRCFLPYLILVLAIFHVMPAFLYMAAFGANVAWLISLRSLITFSSGHHKKHRPFDLNTTSGTALIAQPSDSTF
jgi:phosphatidylglycerophosphate synthase